MENFAGTRKRNKNAVRSKRLLVEAYVQLMQTMPSEKITVTALVNEAGLNRSTFYAHFDRVEDILEYIGEDIVESLTQTLSKLKQEDVLNDPLPMMLQISDFIEERKDFFKKLSCSKTANDFLWQLEEMFVARLQRDTRENISPEEMICLRFWACGYIGICRDWLRGKAEMSLRDISIATANIIKSGIGKYF